MLLNEADFDAGPAHLIEAIRSRLPDPDLWQNLPEPVQLVAHALEVDHEVRNGGFTQYFFNTDGARAVAAWFALEDLDHQAYSIFSCAFDRLSVEFGIDLDFEAAAERGGAEEVVRCEGGLLTIMRAVKAYPGSAHEQLAVFRDELAVPRRDELGFGALDPAWCDKTDVENAVAGFAGAHIEVFAGLEPRGGEGGG